MPERYSLKMPSNWFWLFHEVEQVQLWLSGTTTTWQAPIELNENISCSLVKGYRALMCDKHHFLMYWFIVLYTTKNESWTNGNSVQKIQMCSCVVCARVSGNFSLMLSIHKIHVVSNAHFWSIFNRVMALDQCQNFVCAQYLVNEFVDFDQILHMHWYWEDEIMNGFWWNYVYALILYDPCCDLKSLGK